MFDNLPTYVVIPLIFIGIQVLVFTVPALIAMWEKRLVWNYAIVDLDDKAARRALPKSTFVENTGDDFEDRKFTHVGTGRDAKGEKYQVVYEFWLSPDRRILAVVGGGKIFGISLACMWIFSRLDDGRCILTVSDQNGSELDPTGITEEILVKTTDVREILRRHRNRLALATADVLEYSDDPLKDHLKYRFRRFNALVEMGRAKFLDDEETRWKYTFWGAIMFSIRGISVGMRRQVWPDRDQ